VDFEGVSGAKRRDVVALGFAGDLVDNVGHDCSSPVPQVTRTDVGLEM
jgi:hypothetical protein